VLCGHLQGYKINIVFYIPEDDDMAGHNIKFHCIYKLILIYLCAFVGTTVVYTQVQLVWDLTYHSVLFSENRDVWQNNKERSILSQITNVHAQDTVLTVPSIPLTRPANGDIKLFIIHITTSY
jgi:hypothetical protein